MKKSSENYQSPGHFQSFFIYFFFVPPTLNLKKIPVNHLINKPGLRKSIIFRGWCQKLLPLLFCFVFLLLLQDVLIHRGPYMSAHVLLNLLNKLGKRDKMRDLPSILFIFRNEFNKFNNTRARMLDSIYHMTNTLKPDF